MIRRLAPASIGQITLALALGCAGVALPGQALAQTAVLNLDHLDRLADRAKETVNVTVDEAMLRMAGGFFAGQKNGGNLPTGDVNDILSGLKAVYVRSYSFDNEGEYTTADVEAVRAQLKSPWSRMVAVHDKRSNETVDVFMWQPAGQTGGGMAIVVAEPKELTVVNIVGTIDLAKLAALGGRLGIPQGLGALPSAQRPQAPQAPVAPPAPTVAPPAAPAAPAPPAPAAPPAPRP